MRIRFLPKLIPFILCTFINQIGISQNLGINTTGTNANASSILDVSSPNKGILIPRIALTGTNDVATIPSPVISLLIYNTATVAGTNAMSPGNYSWSGTRWLRESNYNSNWNLTGNASTSPTTNFIGTTDAVDFVASTNKVEHFRITSSGAVNIWSGTRFAAANNYMAPGSLTLGNTATNFGGGSGWTSNVSGLLMECLDNTEIAVHDAGTRIASLAYFEGATTNRIQIGRDMGFGSISTIALNGNVGIGTTTPAFKLDVADRMRVRQGTSGTAGIWFFQTTPNADRAFIGMVDDNNIGLFGAGSGFGLTQNLTTGNVGINSLNPNFKLEVNSPSAWGGMYITGGTTGDALGLTMTNANNYNYSIYNRAYNNNLDIYDDNAGVSRLNITPTGNVGIGTTTPAFKLDVADRMRVRQGANGTAGIWLYQTTPNADRAFIGMYDDDNIGFYGVGGGWGLLQNINTGNVGIGTANPIAKLQVYASTQKIAIFEGPIKLIDATPAHAVQINARDVSGGGMKVFNGMYPGLVYASAFNVISDISMKNNIHPIISTEYEKYLSQIRSIESATFKYNFEPKNSKNKIGVIAQTLPVELQAQMTDKVESGNPIVGMSLADMAGLSLIGIKAIDYKQTEALKIIKERQIIIEELQKEVERLKQSRH